MNITSFNCLQKLRILIRKHCNNYSTVPADLNYLGNSSNFEEIKLNLKRRKYRGNIDEILNKCNKLLESNNKLQVNDEFIKEINSLPNHSHPTVLKLTEEPHVIKELGVKKNFTFKPKTFANISKKLFLTRTEDISHYTGQRSYYLIDQLAELEDALINFFISRLKELKFRLITVPDILPKNIIEACGMNTQGERNQVYRLNEKYGEDLCLSGTAEMGIASFLANKTFNEEMLPLKFAAVSRCFRAETSKISEEKGIYRVHQFTKVEMFAVTTPDQSEFILNDFVNVQLENFIKLNLYLRLLDMPPEELGEQAYRKFDVECYMPGKEFWGELSSASNCTDYQSKRLNIRSINGQFLHTVNSTACAIPRLIISLVETHQDKDGNVQLPECLKSYIKDLRLTRSKATRITPWKESKYLPVK